MFEFSVSRNDTGKVTGFDLGYGVFNWGKRNIFKRQS